MEQDTRMPKKAQTKRSLTEIIREINDCTRVILLLCEHGLVGTKGMAAQQKRLVSLMREYLND